MLKNIHAARAILVLAESAAHRKDFIGLSAARTLTSQLIATGNRDDRIDLARLATYLELLDVDECGCDYAELCGETAKRDQIRSELYASLSMEPHEQVTISGALAADTGPMVRLVSAAYVRIHDDGSTEGVSVSIVINPDGSVNAPRDHFLNQDLLAGISPDDQLLTRPYIAHVFPKSLRSYRLVEGSVREQHIIRYELDHMSF